MKRILLRTAMLILPVSALLGLHLLMSPDIAAQVRSRRTITPRPRRTGASRTTNRDAVFIGGGASTGAIIRRQRRGSSNIIGGGLGTGARNRRNSSITGGALGAGVGGRKRINPAIGAGGAGTYRQSRRNRGRGRN
ncbi:MAG TPA: hypothetical protein VF721_21985 [Pyrinomonadaceae bacterium]